MKKQKITLVTILFIGLFSVFAQEPANIEKIPKFEVSFDALQFTNPNLASISFSFDYLLNESESIGLTTTYRLNDYSLGANYKHFFSKKYAQGFYTEIGLTYNTGKYYPSYNYNPNISLKKYNALNFDFKLGYKLVSKKNFFFDTFVGKSQTVLGTNVRPYRYKYRKLPLDFGIKIGKRF